MNDETLKRAVTNVLDVLVTSAADHLEPEETRHRLRALELPHEVDLVWQRELYDGSLHCDALIKAPSGSISISYCADNGLPWPLRGVRRWSEQDLLQVGERRVTVHEAIAFLDFIWDEAPILDRLVRACIVEEALERGDVKVSSSELQGELDSFRRRRGLHGAQEMNDWLDEQGMTQARLERLLVVEAAVRVLRSSLSSGRVHRVFQARRHEFGRTIAATMAFSNKLAAEDARRRIVSGDSDFYTEFERAAADERAQIDSFVGGNGDAPTELATAREGEVVGPLRHGRGFALMRVVTKADAELDQRTRLVIEDCLFREWVARERRMRRIEWSWGPPTSGDVFTETTGDAVAMESADG